MYITIHPERNMNICTKFLGNPWCTKIQYFSLDQSGPTDSAICKAMLLAFINLIRLNICTRAAALICCWLLTKYYPFKQIYHQCAFVSDWSRQLICELEPGQPLLYSGISVMDRRVKNTRHRWRTLSKQTHWLYTPEAVSNSREADKHVLTEQ